MALRYSRAVLLFLSASCSSELAVDLGSGPAGQDDGGPAAGDTGEPADTADAGDTAGDSAADSAADSAEPEPEPADCNVHGFVLQHWAHLASGSSLDAYDPSYGPWSADNQVPGATLSVNSTEACALTVGGTVQGDVYTGGDPASAVCEEWGASITGARVQLDAPIEISPATLPGGLPADEGDRTVAWGDTWTIAEDHVVSGLLLAYGSAIAVERSAVVVVEGDLAADGASITVAEGAVLELYVTGNARLGYGVTVDAGGESSRVRWRMVGGGTLTMDWGSKLQAAVEIADGTFVNGGGDFMGTVAGSAASAAWGAAMHVDLSRICGG